MSSPDILIYQHNYYKPQLDKAIKLTQQYVSDNKLILTGGMAIDLALRVKDSSIYDDDQLPDYDVISDQNLFHAHELAKILCNAGLPDINVINAVHITTVRVRIRRDVLLDATYIPASIFYKIPYLDTDHFRVIHPHYQFIDQRSSLGMLLLDKGITLNIFNRLKKDIERNNLLRKYYPIQMDTKYDIKYKLISIPLKWITIDDSKFKKIDDSVFIYTGISCISGYAAYYFYMNVIDPVKYPITVIDDNLEIKIPENIKFSILSYDIENVKGLLKSPTTFRQLLSIKPVTLVDDKYEIMDSYGIRVGCFAFNLPNGAKVCIASTDYVLSELLRDRVYVAKEPYTTFYSNLVQRTDLERSIETSADIWFPSINCYGYDSMPEHKTFDLEKMMDLKASSNLRPKSEYLRNPMCAIKRESFDAPLSHYFQIDGAEDDSIAHTNYKYISDAFKEFTRKKRNESW